MLKKFIPATALLLLIASCGGSGGSSSAPAAVTPTPPPVVTTPTNTLAVTVDAGPTVLTSTGDLSANTLFATLTICTPGSTTACRTIDHVQVDTGSTGLRLLSSTLGSAAPSAVREPITGRPLLECVQFADGYSFGSVGTVDVTMGGRTITGLPIHVIGDPAAGTAPSSCASGPAENTVRDFGANGVLGIGNFLQDCGPACVNRAVAGTYYTCPTTAGGSACTPTTVALAQQVPNPVGRLASDNNGIVVQMPAVASPGAATVAGTVLFGVGTQANNALGSARVYALSSQGTFTATANGTSYSGSFIDSGSNAYFFPSTIPTCKTNTSFYCPVTSSGAATSVSQSVIINGTNGVSSTVTFNVDNADQLFTTTFTAFPGLAGTSGTLLNGSAGTFDFGLPFFYGRSVAVVIEGSTVGGVTGPAIAF